MDTPGYDDRNPSDAKVLMMVLQKLADLYKSRKLLNGIFYLHRLSHPRFGRVDSKVRTQSALCGSFGSLTLLRISTCFSNSAG